MTEPAITQEKLLEVMPYVLFGIMTGMYVEHNNIINKSELERHEADLNETLKALLTSLSTENAEQERSEFQNLITNTLTPTVANFVHNYVSGARARNNVTGEEQTVMRDKETPVDENYANNLAFQSMLALPIVQKYGFDDLDDLTDGHNSKIFMDEMNEANKHIFEDGSDVEYKQHDLAITLARVSIKADEAQSREENADV